MIYVLSGSRRETVEWAKSQDIPLRSARHVYTSSTLPGRISKTQRVVQLPGFAKRRDRHAIAVQLRRCSNGKAQVELWTLDNDGKYFCALAMPTVDPEPTPEMPLDELSALAAGFDADEDFSVDEETESPTPLEDDEPAPATVTITPTKDDPPAHHAELVERVLPSGLTTVTNETGQDEIILTANLVEHVLSQTPDELREIGATEEEVQQVADINQLAEKIESDQAETPKPKRKGRRTNEQKAYDETLADYHDNKATLEQVIAARDAMAARHPDDERLLTAPQSDAELDEAAEDDDALDF